MKKLLLIAAALASFPIYAQVDKFNSYVSFLKSLEADSVDFDLMEHEVYLRGNVKIAFPPYSIDAEEIVYKIDENVLVAKGNTIFQYQDKIISKSEEVEVNIDDRSFFASQIISLLQGRYMTRTSRIIANQDLFTFQSNSLTTCYCEEGQDPEWELIAARGSYDVKKSKLTLQDVGLNILGFPVIPQKIKGISIYNLDRKNSFGFVDPQIYYDKTISLAVKLPFYIPVRDNFDITVTPTLSMGGIMTFLQGRVYKVGVSQHQMEIGIPIGGNLAEKKKLFKSRKFLRFIGSIKPRDKVDIGYQWTFADDMKFLRSYSLQKKLVLRNQIYLRSHNKNSLLDLRILQIKDQNPWWGEGGSYTIPFMPIVKFQKRQNYPIGLFTTKNSIMAGNEILKVKDTTKSEEPFLVFYSKNMLDLQPMTIGDWTYNASIGFAAQVTPNKGKLPLQFSPILRKKIYNTYIRKGFIVEPFISILATGDLKGLDSKREIKLPNENPFATLPDLPRSNPLKETTTVRAIGIEIKKLGKNGVVSVTPGVIFKKNGLLVGGNSKIELRGRRFVYKNAISFNPNKDETQSSHSAIFRRNNSLFSTGLDISSGKTKNTTVVTTFQTPFSENAILHTSFQKTTKPYKSSTVTAGVLFELNSLSLSAEMQLNEKRDFMLVFKIGLRGLFSFGTNALLS